ncbi:selenocysteine-specific translation elongation factor [Lentibacillus kapialis]|uniref:Selenocysteine-specific elongation factor n=1 Tax=Lentibacillus kapialis TaxID=340214 RepID=A0A917UW12_9BACI|nr:selenocysteine-specific translation elongation factor [Lentibacillus kapialis]GGJ88832.1 selenocysteine-specific translation elongation factor [Lentibacillus kapialis]
MDDAYFTIGMAGHIDHGKTALTKALTNVDTDRLKEEKERKVSIEPGYAPLETKDGSHVSIVDVPGHERFIRQMIAGVAGIDLVILVIAADEGVMPQTREHLQILEFLGVQHCIVAVSKIDRVDAELLDFAIEDIRESIAGTIFSEVPLVCVDSISGKGIDQLRRQIVSELEKTVFRDAYGSFRLPIDQVFTVRGQGTIVRGTIYEGIVQKGSPLTILPGGYKVRARQIQVHRQGQRISRAGQRTAINLSGIDKEDIERGDVLVASDHFLVTNTIDVNLQLVENLSSPVKQRMPVKVHTGTSEVMGRIVFFDRNEVIRDDDDVLCQIRLEEKIVVCRGDRFILRRPTPVETLGGGWVIEPKGNKYRFGETTMDMLQKKKDGTPEDLVKDVLMKHKLLNVKQLIQYTSFDEPGMKAAVNKGIDTRQLVQVTGDKYALAKDVIMIKDMVSQQLQNRHDEFPMRPGISKAEIVQSFNGQFPKRLVEFGLDSMLSTGEIQKDKQFLALSGFTPYLPEKWKTQMEAIINQLEADGLQVKRWTEYITHTTVLKQEAEDLHAYLIHTEQAHPLTRELIIHHKTFTGALLMLKAGTNETFGLKEAKDALQVSRKYLVPFLELLDQYKLTKRVGDNRKWI